MLKKGRNRKKSRNSFTTLLISFLLVVSIVSAYSEESFKAEIDRLIANGDTGRAVAALKTWLRTNPGHEMFTSYLDRYFFLESNILSLRDFITELIEVADSGDHIGYLIEKKAIIEEMSGQLGSAQQSYHEAATYMSDIDRRAVHLLESTRLLYEEGYLDRANEELSSVFMLTENSDILVRAFILKVYIAMAKGDNRTAEEKLLELLINPSAFSLRSEVLLSLVIINKNNREAAEIYFEKLARDYPKSPEYSLALKILHGQDSTVSFLLTPQRYFEKFLSRREEENDIAVPSEQFYIQTGSFSNRENALYMISDLSSAGFGAEINTVEKEGRVYHRVLVGGFNSLDIAGIRLRELKSHGFEGFIVIGKNNR